MFILDTVLNDVVAYESMSSVYTINDSIKRLSFLVSKRVLKSFVCSILRQIAFSPQLHASTELYDDSHRQNKQLRDG